MFVQCMTNVSITFCKVLIWDSTQVKNSLVFKSLLLLAVVLISDNEPDFI